MYSSTSSLLILAGILRDHQEQYSYSAAQCIVAAGCNIHPELRHFFNTQGASSPEPNTARQLILVRGSYSSIIIQRVVKYARGLTPIGA